MLRLPGITKICYVPADKLMSGITQRALANIPIGVFADIFFVPFVGEPICETETEFDNNAYRQKVQLTFSTTSSLPTCHLAFIIRTVEGKQYLIGTGDHPFPIVKSTDSTGELDGDAAIIKYNYLHKQNCSCALHRLKTPFFSHFCNKTPPFVTAYNTALFCKSLKINHI